MAELRRSTRIAGAKRKLDDVDSIKKDSVDHNVKKKSVKSKIDKGHKVNTPNAVSKELDVGDEIPDISLLNEDGEKVSLRKVAIKNRIIVIFVYPKASTPGCTRQACGFRDNYEDLKKHAVVYGLSADSEMNQKKFQAKQKLPYSLLSDPKREFIGLLGAKKTPQSGTIRSHFIFVDGKLKFKRIKISPEVSVSDSKKEVLELSKQYDI